MIDYALDQAFAISKRRTLVINCLPMGVVFSSSRATVATTSVREDMATALGFEVPAGIATDAPHSLPADEPATAEDVAIMTGEGDGEDEQEGQDSERLNEK